MQILGVDLAGSAGSTGAVTITPFTDGAWRASPVPGSLDDDRLVSLAHDADRIGIDAPLGWPDDFVAGVAAHHVFEPWPGGVDRSLLVYRETDRRTRRHLGRFPLSVSADLLGVVGMRCALLQRRWADEVWGVAAPRDGSGALAETYPAAALKVWGIEAKGYKSRSDTEHARAVRIGIVERLVTETGGWLDMSEVRGGCVDSDHVLDAMLCALVAVAVGGGLTERPDDDVVAQARREGWIHVPTAPLSAVRP